VQPCTFTAITDTWPFLLGGRTIWIPGRTEGGKRNVGGEGGGRRERKEKKNGVLPSGLWPYATHWAREFNNYQPQPALDGNPGWCKENKKGEKKENKVSLPYLTLCGYPQSGSGDQFWGLLGTGSQLHLSPKKKEGGGGDEGRSGVCVPHLVLRVYSFFLPFCSVGVDYSQAFKGVEEFHIMGMERKGRRGRKERKRSFLTMSSFAESQPNLVQSLLSSFVGGFYKIRKQTRYGRMREEGKRRRGKEKPLPILYYGFRFFVFLNSSGHVHCRIYK